MHQIPIISTSTEPAIREGQRSIAELGKLLAQKKKEEREQLASIRLALLVKQFLADADRCFVENDFTDLQRLVAKLGYEYHTLGEIL